MRGYISIYLVGHGWSFWNIYGHLKEVNVVKNEVCAIYCELEVMLIYKKKIQGIVMEPCMQSLDNLFAEASMVIF